MVVLRSPGRSLAGRLVRVIAVREVSWVEPFSVFSLSAQPPSVRSRCPATVGGLLLAVFG
jgi:hypothetical protein